MTYGENGMVAMTASLVRAISYCSSNILNNYFNNVTVHRLTCVLMGWLIRKVTHLYSNKFSNHWNTKLYVILRRLLFLGVNFVNWGYSIIFVI